MNKNWQGLSALCRVEEMLAVLGDRSGLSEITPLQGGNNRVYKISTDQKTYILKKYFKSETEQRDRFQAESLFFNHLDESGTAGQAPGSLLWEPDEGMALFEFIRGRKLNIGEVNKAHLDQALAFIKGINAGVGSESKTVLFSASDACYSIAEYLESVADRMGALMALRPADGVDSNASVFIRKKLVPAWEIVKDGLSDYPDKEKKLKSEEQIVSPSDFGFHNAILRENGDICFIDFEYAGWDDPVKMVCDFFCQPEVPVPFKYFDWFSEEITNMVRPIYDLKEKALALFPLHRLKWCCIMLNVFLKKNAQPKQFASFDNDRRTLQLEKTREYVGQYFRF